MSYYATVGSPSTRLCVLAYAIHPDAKPVPMATRALAWTPEVHNAFRVLAHLLREGEPPRLIPYRVLRSLLDLHVPTTLRQHETLALKFSTKTRRTTSEKMAFAWFSIDAPPEPTQVSRAIHQWFETALQPLAIRIPHIADLTTDFIECKLIRLPKDTHGPRPNLPHHDVKNAAERGQQRMEAWRSWTETLREQMHHDAIIGLLVVAPKWYGGKPDGFRRDDFVNKSAGRKAISSWAQQLVQYLLPTKGPQASNKAEFCLRAQNAWRDLTWAHYGQFKDLHDSVKSFFPNGASPQEIIGIAIVRRNKKRTGQQGSDIPVALKLDLATNQCFICLSYWDQERLVMTEWEPLRSGLLRLASLSPIRSGENRERQSICFEKFCTQVMDKAGEQQMQPLILILSTNASSRWHWLRDTDLDPQKIFTRSAGHGLHQKWRGARIVRIREEHAPPIILDKRRKLAQSSETDARRRNELVATEDIHIPTSPNTQLFRVSNASCRYI